MRFTPIFYFTMKQRFYIIILQFVCWVNFLPVVIAQSTLEDRLKQHVYTLAADSLAGRKAGSEYAKKAAAYIAAQWEEIGLTPLTGETYLQPFQLGYFNNLSAIIEGNDPLLKNEYLVIGAHYDHLGGKVNEKGEIVIYNGADDNASGVATVIELGRRLKELQSTLRRSVVLLAFDAEEIGLFGSDEFAGNPPFPVENIKLMMSIDMVGWYKTSGYVRYSGAATFINGKNLLLDETLNPAGLHVKIQNFERSLFTATDTKGFAEKGIPTLSVTTGDKSPYHKPEDMAHLIDYEGMALITQHLTNVVQALSRDDDFHASGKIAPIHKTSNKFTFGISANTGSNYHHYTKGALNGKSSIAFGVGLNGQLNMKFFAVRPEVYYDCITAQHPQGKITTYAITVPFNLLLQTSSSSAGGAALFAGPYYRYKMSGKQGKTPLDFDNLFYRNEGGFNIGLEIWVTRFRLGFVSRTALTNFSQTRNVDDAPVRNRTSYLILGYIF